MQTTISRPYVTQASYDGGRTITQTAPGTGDYFEVAVSLTSSPNFWTFETRDGGVAVVLDSAEMVFFLLPESAFMVV
jgi:hypothetical protein